jgi:hypothetical protein
MWKVCAICLLLYASSASAWIRRSVSDDELVERSELIVIAHLSYSGIEYVDHPDPQRGHSWEHHALLTISSVMKGTCQQKEIPVIFRYGLSPMIGGKIEHANLIVKPPMGEFFDPRDAVKLLDTAEHHGPEPIDDLRQNSLWFLRKRTGVYGEEPGGVVFGIADPEEVQAVKWTDYFHAYLEDDAETALRKYIFDHPDAVQRSLVFFGRQDLKRILKLNDPQQRFDRMMPMYFDRALSRMQQELESAILACGDIAGYGLLKIVDDSDHQRNRKEILRLWYKMAFKPAAPTLIALLQKHDAFWATQKLGKNWWSDSKNPELYNLRREVYGETYNAVCALHAMQVESARPILQQTMNRWKAFGFENQQIVEECELALEDLGQSSPSAPAAR